LRRIILGLAAVAACMAIQLVAQPAHPPSPPTASPLQPVLRPHTHARPVQPNAPHIPAAGFDATSLGTPLLLDKGWRVGISGDPAAASPAFDDSAWAVRDAQDFIADVPGDDHPLDPSAQSIPSGQFAPAPGHQRPFTWFRLHIRLAPGHGPLALLIELPVTQNANLAYNSQTLGVDVFANGKQIQPEGPHADAPEQYQQVSRLYNLKLDPSETSLTLAVRTLYVPFGYGAYTGFFGAHNLQLGPPDALSKSLELWTAHSLFERLPRLVASILLVFLALFLLALYFSQKGHVEYLWLALHELLQAPLGFVELAGNSARLDQLWYVALYLQLTLVSAYLYFEFLVAFLSLRRRWYIRALRYTAPVMALVGPALLLVGQSTAIGILLAVALVGSFFWVLGWLVFILVTLLAATLRRNFEAGLLLIPLLLTLVGWGEPVLTGGMSNWGGRGYHSPLTLQAGPIPIHFAAIADFTGLFVIVLIVFGRFLRVQREQQRTSSELAAARSVQELMIPHERLETPGFEVESIYNPATEVGGDFYHVQPTPDGGLLVVIGDVAGKGLKAAMNVSMLMGALRRTPERSPAKILESLNRVLVGSDSFTTCQAAWLGPNGEVVLANAGHLPPYLNSQEVKVPGGLPLGVLLDLSYEEIRLYLHPGDRILFLSDGVVEARRPSGELFGFDRVHNLSNQSAFYIADAAREFGQEDDITVLTVRRLAQAMAA
jgi:hypothetical protein